MKYTKEERLEIGLAKLRGGGILITIIGEKTCRLVFTSTTRTRKRTIIS